MLPSCRAFYHQFCSHHGAKSKIPTKSVNFLWRGKRNVVFNMNFEKIHSNTKFLLTKLPCSTLCSSHQKKGSIKNDTSFFGAEGETRTLAPVTRPTPLAGAPRHHLSTSPKWQRSFFRYSVLCTSRRFLKWRRRWDSNPRNIAVQRFSRPPP